MAAITLTVGYIEKRFSLFPHHVQKTNIFTTLTAVDTTQFKDLNSDSTASDNFK